MITGLAGCKFMVRKANWLKTLTDRIFLRLLFFTGSAQSQSRILALAVLSLFMLITGEGLLTGFADGLAQLLYTWITGYHDLFHSLLISCEARQRHQ